MAPSKARVAVKWFIWWGKPLSNTKHTCKKVGVTQLNVSQEIKEYKNVKISKNGPRMTQKHSPGDIKQLYAFRPSG